MYRNEIDRYVSKHGFGAFSPKAVLFDMDGVLFDSMPHHASSWAKVCSEFGLHMTPTEAYMHEGRTAASTINLLSNRTWGRNATEAEIEKIYAEKCRLFNSLPEAEKMPGAAQVLKQVKQAGLQIIVSSKDVRHGKPDPEPYLMGLKKLGLQPWEAIVVENAPLGVRAAVAAQIFTIAVNTGPLPESALLGEGANLIFPSMSAFAKQFKEFIANSL